MMRIIKFLNIIKSGLVFLAIFSPAVVFAILQHFYPDKLKLIENPFIIIYLLIGTLEWLFIYCVIAGWALSLLWDGFKFIKNAWKNSK